MPISKVPLSIGGTAIVVCGHGKIKRQVTEIEFDRNESEPNACACCENMFLLPKGVKSSVCGECNPSNYLRKEAV